jgi:hypothetical protein
VDVVDLDEQPLIRIPITTRTDRKTNHVLFICLSSIPVCTGFIVNRDKIWEPEPVGVVKNRISGCFACKVKTSMQDARLCPSYWNYG